MSRLHHTPLAAALLALVAGCNNNTTIATPAAFDRPEAISFFCSDGTTIVPFVRCRPDDPEDTTPNSTAKDPDEPFEIYGVVTQTGTGEVAAVQITGETDDPPGVIDTDIRIPGYTFAAVGEVPSAVVTPPGPDDPDAASPQSQFTYVINRGTSTMNIIETSTFRGPRGAKVRTVPPLDDGSDSYFPPDSRPTSMELTPDQRELVITLPNIGEVWFVPIDGADVGAPVRVALSSDVPPPVDFTSPDVPRPPSYQLTCNLTADPVPSVPPRAPVSLGATPEPWAVVIDGENGRALVSDRSLPIIHVLDLATHAELAPIVVQVPTRELALTPRVPSGDPQHIAADAPRDQRVLYAIDETDQSVLAVDYSDPESSSFGGVLPVASSGTIDRLEVPFPARAIEVVTPRYSETEPLRFCTSASDVAPAQLHGVFLAVATTDGRVRIFDIFDLDAPCRGTTCGHDTNAKDNGVAIGRNRPRIGVFIDDPTSSIEIDPPPSWTVGAATVVVTPTGTASDARLPALSSVTCPSGLGPVFPINGGSTLVCAVTDPWSAISQRFEVAWNGTVPFTAGTGAVLSGSTIEVRFDPCELGVIGREQVPASGYLSDYGGDVVAITSAVSPAITGDLAMRCSELVQETTSGETSPVLLPVLRAEAEAAVTDADASAGTFAGRIEVGDPINVSGFTLADVASCFPDLLHVEIRVNQAYLVQSGRAGFRNAIVRGEGGACAVDAGLADAFERGRAFPRTLFRTPEFAIQLASAANLEPTEQASLTMSVSHVPVPLAYDVSQDPTSTSSTNNPSLLAELHYNPVDERLYVIDQANRGLIRLNLTNASQPIDRVFR